MPPLINKEEMDAMDSGDESDDEPISTEMLEDILDGSHSHPRVNRREARYKIHDSIKQRQLERKGAFKYTQNMGKGLQKVFGTDVEEISQNLPILGEYGSEVYYFIPEPKNFVAATRLSDEKKKPFDKSN